VDERIGGRQIDSAVARFAAKEFVKTNKLGDADVLSSPKARVKLMKAANDLKLTLSASKSATLSVEKLYNDLDFTLEFDRPTFEKAWEHLTPKFLDPVNQALAKANITLADINSFEIIGGVSRVPKI
jgi:hypoxia up-regulated 1